MTPSEMATKIQEFADVVEAKIPDVRWRIDAQVNRIECRSTNVGADLRFAWQNGAWAGEVSQAPVVAVGLAALVDEAATVALADAAAAKAEQDDTITKLTIA